VQYLQYNLCVDLSPWVQCIRGWLQFMRLYTPDTACQAPGSIDRVAAPRCRRPPARPPGNAAALPPAATQNATC
jgi:hypothetical protein